MEQSPLNDNRFCALEFFSDLFKEEELTDADLFIYLHCLQNFLIAFHRDQYYYVLVAYILSNCRSAREHIISLQLSHKVEVGCLRNTEIEFINWGADNLNFATVESLKNMSWHFER